MALKAIVQRISLEGGAAIKAQLEAIGTAGKKAFTDLQNAVGQGKGFGAIGRAIDDARARAVALGAAGKKLGDDLGSLGDRARGTSARLGLMGAATAAAVTGIAAFVIKGGEAVDVLEKIATELGITTQEWENTRNAAEQAGVSEEELSRAYRQIRKEQTSLIDSTRDTAKKRRELTREFTDGTLSALDYQKASNKLNREIAEGTSAFDRYGVSVFNADGSLRSAIQIGDDIADTLAGIGDATQRSVAAVDLLGSKSAKTLAFFGNGATALARMRAEAERTAPALNEFQKGALGAAGDAFDRLKRAAESAVNGIRAVFAPSFTAIFDSLTEAVARNRDRFLTFASDLASKVRPVIADVIAVLEGRDADVKNSFIIKARDAIVSFGQAASNAVNNIILPALNALLTVLGTVAQAINGLFGTNLTGGQIAIALVITNLLGLFGLLAGAIKVAVSAIGLLAAAFGGLPLVIAAVGAAIGVVLVNALRAVDWAGFATAAANAWSNITSGVAGAGQSIVDAFGSAINTVTGFFEGLWNKITNIFSGLVSRARQVVDAVRGALSGGGGGSSGGQGFASGGYVRGPGTSRSDSIPAMLSNREYVHNARAVSYYGVDFMNAINRMRIPVAAIRDAVSGFSMGGLVGSLGSVAPRGVPRFADGGLVMAAAGGAKTALNLHFPGGMIGPVMADDEVVAALRRKATGASMKSAGRKPSWMGG